MVRPRCYKEGKQHLEKTRLQKYYLKIIEIIRLLQSINCKKQDNIFSSMPIYKTRLYLTYPIHCNHPERNPGKANYHCQLFEGTDNKTSCDDFAIMCIFSSNKPCSCFQVGDFHRQGLPSCDFHLLITRSISPCFIVSLQYLNHEITHMQSDRVQLIN